MNVVIGGGLTGLTAAYELAKKGEEVRLIEKENYLGGLVGSVERKDYSIERYYHHLFENFSNVIGLIDELKLTKRLVKNKADTGFYDQRLYRLSSPIDLLFFKPLSFGDKLNLAKIVLKMGRVKDPSKFDRISVKDWVVGNSSQRVFDKFFKPLVLSKYSDCDNISAAWFIERMKLRNKRGAGGERLIYLRDGFGQMVKELEKRILDNGGKINLSATVKSASTDGKKIKSVRIGPENVKVDSLISTINPTELARIVKGFRPPKLKHQGSACVLIALKRQVHPYYWTNIIKPQLRFGAIIEHTNFMPLEDYSGEHLIYLASYPTEKSPVWGQKESQVFESYLADLRKIFPVKKADVLKYWVFRNRESGLVFEKGTASKILPCKTEFKNLFIGGMFNSYPERSMDESVRLGRECARLATGD